MIEEAVLSQLLILGARHTIVGIRINADASTGRKDACNLYILRLHQLYKVFHNDVYTVFMKVAMVSEAKEIQL